MPARRQRTLQAARRSLLEEPATSDLLAISFPKTYKILVAQSKYLTHPESSSKPKAHRRAAREAGRTLIDREAA